MLANVKNKPPFSQRFCMMIIQSSNVNIYLYFYTVSLCPMLLGSSGGSVEGYCPGEKEVLDAFNRWVNVCPFFNMFFNLAMHKY